MCRKGFTLIELLVVISIVSLLSTVVLSSLNTAREKARMGAAKQFSGTIGRALGDMLVGAWNLDDCANGPVRDSSGYSNNGSLTGSPTWSSDTPFGFGCSLSLAVGQGFTVPDSPVLDIGLGSATRAMWFKTAQASAALMRKSDSSNANGMIMNLVAGNPQCYVHTNGTLSVVGAGVYSDGAWHYMACVLDRTANTLSIYVDGTLRGSASAAPVNGVNLDASSGVSIPTPYFDTAVMLDDIRFYNKALTAMEVRKAYADAYARPVALD